MTLLLVFVLLTVGFGAVFLGVTVVAHGYLYQEPAPRLPIRALLGGALLGGFLTLWTAVDKSRPGQYDTFFNFVPYTTTEFTEFEAVRWPIGSDDQFKKDANGKDAEVIVKFKRAAGGKGSTFVQEGTNETFTLSSTDSNSVKYMTGAIRVKGPGDAEPVRYNARLLKDDDERRSVRTKAYPKEGRRFEEEKGSRYVEAVQIGTLFVPSTGTIAISLLLNFSLLLMWLVVTWPVLRYTFLHAAGLTAVGTLVTMLALMPLLFKFNRPAPKPAPGAPAVTLVVDPIRADRFA